MILLLLLVLASEPSRVPEWDERFLVLTTGRAPYRPLAEEARAAFLAGDSRAVLRVARFSSEESSRDWQALRDLARDLGESAPAPLLEAVERQDSVPRKAFFLSALGGAGDSRAAAAVAGYLDDPDRRMRLAAAHALGDLGATGMIPLLARLATDPETSVRRMACDAVRRLLERAEEERAAIEEEIRPAMEKAFADPDAWVRRNARRAMRVR